MHIEAKSQRCWKCSPGAPHAHFPPGSRFRPIGNAVATGLTFVNVLCTQSESKIPILMENNKNHTTFSPKGPIGFSSLDVSDTDEPRYEIQDPYELTNAIPSTNEQYNDCFTLHSTIHSQSPGTNSCKLVIVLPQTQRRPKGLHSSFQTEIHK